ncbi:MAG: hypothetical protein IJW81_06680 [Clostridia bacterium]|nr:hypothetical protein [Clostridia bacterium]
MKSKKLTVPAIVIAAAAAFGVTTAAAYDSSEDPLISLSYLTKIFKTELLEELNETIEAEIAERMQNLDMSQYQPPKEEPKEEPVPAVSSTYEVIELSWGDALYAASACDIMLRSVQAYCIEPDASQGIADYTAGTEIYNYEYLTNNHMCLIPRGDGRGIMADAQSVFVMVRGEYTIVEG